ncbi:MAG: hypothetical protein CRN43_13815 [Candidatus Nephrothrix sp. EaCA]|nr:MAG: hypothetical protein CRN43_13815 [Candidatus Nephrothrix sp. EaCA]
MGKSCFTGQFSFDKCTLIFFIFTAIIINMLEIFRFFFEEIKCGALQPLPPNLGRFERGPTAAEFGTIFRREPDIEL